VKHDHTFFQNRECTYFPCHAGADPETFNCLFCYCPLYHFKDCGGDFARRGLVKDCTRCLRPHGPGGYAHVQARLGKYFAARRKAGEAKDPVAPAPSPEPASEE
jgi:Zn-finger protein